MTQVACRAVMMAVRERAVKVMAALVRRVPSLDDFVGESWSSWVEWAGVTAADGLCVDDLKNDKKAAEAMPLSKEDMSIFGLFPGHDDFYLVVCNHCGQVVKPQAFEKHCEKRHGPLAKLYAKLRSVNPASQPQRPPHSHSPSHAAPNLPVQSWESRTQASGPARNTPPSRNTPSPATPPQYRHSKSPKDVSRHSPLEKSSHNSHSEHHKVFKAPPVLEPQMSSPPASLRDPPWPHGGGPPIRPTPSDRPPTPKKEALLSSSVPAHRVPRVYNKVASKRECDLDKHCGVLDPDRKKVCTRLLTCNIHSIHQRRKVLGRSKNFDQLVAELKTKAREKGFQNAEGGLCAKRSPSPEAPKDQAGSPHCRRPLANHPAFSHPSVLSEKKTEEEESEEEVLPRSPSPMIPGGVASDDSEGESPDEPVECHFSAAHPRPLSVCSFGSHAVGHGIFTFDRRLHHLRSALSSMIEQHISAHLWKKIPQATDIQSPPSSTKASSSSSTLHSKVRTGSHIGSLLKTPASIPLTSHGTAKLTPSHSGSSRFNSSVADANSAIKHTGTKNAMKRSNKQMLKLREEVVNAAALRKRKAPSQDGEHSGPNRNCTPPQDRHFPSTHTAPFGSSASSVSSALSHGQTNGTQSPSSKPRPHSSPTDSHRRTHPSPVSSSPSSTPNNNSQRRGATGDSGSHSQDAAQSMEHHSLLKKRKGGSTEERFPTSKSPVPQHRLPASPVPSTPPRSSFYTLKDGKIGALSRGMDKKLATQKPKLHH